MQPWPDQISKEQHETAVDDSVVEVLGWTVELQQSIHLFRDNSLNKISGNLSDVHLGLQDRQCFQQFFSTHSSQRSPILPSFHFAEVKCRRSEDEKKIETTAKKLFRISLYEEESALEVILDNYWNNYAAHISVSMERTLLYTSEFNCIKIVIEQDGVLYSKMCRKKSFQIPKNFPEFFRQFAANTFLHYVAISLLWGVTYRFKLVQCLIIVRISQVLGV